MRKHWIIQCENQFSRRLRCVSNCASREVGQQEERRKQMTPEAQRIAIAEACGLKIQDIPFVPALVFPHDGKRFTEAAFTEYRKAYPSGAVPMSIPDYLNDLNACHEMEKVLNGKKSGGLCST